MCFGQLVICLKLDELEYIISGAFSSDDNGKRMKGGEGEVSVIPAGIVGGLVIARVLIIMEILGNSFSVILPFFTQTQQNESEALQHLRQSLEKEHAAELEKMKREVAAQKENEIQVAVEKHVAALREDIQEVSLNTAIRVNL